MKILLVEDEAPIREVIKRGLEEDGVYTVDTAEDGRVGLDLACDKDYVLIILDLMLPGIDGWTICEQLRNRRVNTPILMLTARDTVRDRVRGLELGADDYLPKPFDFDELLARVRALIRRDKLSKGKVIRIGHLEMDTIAHRVLCDGKEVALTSREFSLLEALAVNEGRVMSRDAIQYRVWNNEDSLSNTVDVYIRMLRRKIDADRPVKLIHTVHGLGYMLKRPDEESS
ncbi:MAG: response regulator transcription factor [Armatimonadota bacterium]|nr:response regulator transcription factor [bacterium]